MRIALCDWDEIFIKKIKNIIYSYAESFKIEFVADCYTSGEELINSKVQYNIIFLGYKLTGINGLETAKIIRKNNFATSIVFVSEYTDFVFDTFKVKPLDFLVKPVSENAIFKTLDDYFDTMGIDSHILVKSREYTMCLNASEIYFLEADNKYCHINLKNEVLDCTQTMAKVYDSLPKEYFVKINRAYIVNLNFIKKYNKDEVYLSNNTALHISRNYLKPFKEDFNRFFSQR